MAIKKPRTFKKVTEIPSAKVTIEVEETEEKTPLVEEAKVEEKDTEENKEVEIASTEPEEAESEETSEEIAEAAEETENIETKAKEDVPVNIDGSDGEGKFGIKKLILTILIVVPIGFLAFGGFLYFSKNFNTDALKREPEKKIEIPEASPTPTEEPLDKEAFTIEVQNGSGIAGEGASVGEMLEEEGFKIGDIGNADDSNYTDTIITVNTEVPDSYVEELTKVLEKRGPVGKVKKFATGEDGEVLIIVGSELGLSDEEATPTPEE